MRTLVDAIKKREQARDLLQAKVEHLDGLRKASESFDAGALDKQIREALTDWWSLLDGHPEAARQVLRKLLTTPIYVVPLKRQTAPATSCSAPVAPTAGLSRGSSVSRPESTQSCGP